MGRKKGAKKVVAIPIPSCQNQMQLNLADTDIVIFKISDVYGRYLEAKTNIAKGSMILSENFLIAGPLRSSDSVCLGCHAGIDTKDRKSYQRCSGCSWQMCSKKCADSSFHREECNFFADRKIQPPTSESESFDFGLITVLRGLLLKISDPPSWKTLLRLEHHNELRKLLPLWEENKNKIVNVICEKWKLRDLFSEDEIHTVCGILEVNAFEMGSTFSFRGIFPNLAMLAHNCVPNVTQYENPIDGIIEIRAAVDISAGDTIFLNYAFALQPTYLRRKMLQDTKFFNCICRRCSEPTELGSHLNTLICQVCKTGFLMSDDISQTDEFGSCNKCQNRMKNKDIQMVLINFGLRSRGLPDIESRERFLNECIPIFHSRHFIPFGVKFNLCQAYGRENVHFLNLSQLDLERKSEICSEVLEVLNIVCPGYNITRGLVLYEYQAAEVMLARRIFETRKYTKSILRKKLENSLEILLEAITILTYSHPSTDEHKMGQAAKEDGSILGLQQWISALK